MRTVAIMMAACVGLSCSGDDATDSGGNGSSDASGTGTAGGRTADDGDTDAPADGSTAAPDTDDTSGPDPDSSGSDDPETGSDDSTGEPPANPGPVVVYVADGQSSVQRWNVEDEAGTISQQQTMDTGPGAATLAMSPDGQYLYATARGGNVGNRVITYGIAPADGALTELGVVPLEIDPVYFGVDNTGQFGMSASFGGDEIGLWAIAADGTVTESAIEVLDAGDEPHAIVPHPTGAWAYVPHRGTNEVRQYAYDAVDGLTLLDTVPAADGAGARHLSFTPDGSHAYVSDEFSDSVTHFSVAADTGALTRLETLSTIPKRFDGGNNTCADVHVSPDGAFVYVSNRGHDSLAMFEIDAASGVLTGLGEVDTETTPREFEVDPTGQFVFSAGQSSGAMVGYTIAETGVLIPGQTVTIGGSPSWVLAVELPAR